MTKHVYVSIQGLHSLGEEQPVEVICGGTYYFKNKKHYVLYEEISDSREVLKTTLKISGDMVQVIRSGKYASSLVFEKNKNYHSVYQTPFGGIEMDIYTSEIQIEDMENELKVKLHYTLSMNKEQTSECEVAVKIKAKPDHT